MCGAGARLRLIQYFLSPQGEITLVLDYGVMALLDGALKELLMLALNGIISLAAYLVFKACEKWLVEKLLK